jgi:predicted metal-dependent peptidase
MDEEDIEGILNGEFEEDEDLEDEEEETEEDAADRLRAEISDRFDEENGRMGIVQVYDCS